MVCYHQNFAKTNYSILHNSLRDGQGVFLHAVCGSQGLPESELERI